MSDNWMIVLPIDPLAVPPRERAEAALEMLSQLRPEAQEFDLHLRRQFRKRVLSLLPDRCRRVVGESDGCVVK
jgi:hypothetical protein